MSRRGKPFPAGDARNFAGLQFSHVSAQIPRTRRKKTRKKCERAAYGWIGRGIRRAAKQVRHFKTMRVNWQLPFLRESDGRTDVIHVAVSEHDCLRARTGARLHLYAMPIPPLYGHEGIRNRLAGALAAGRLPQALLFEGPPGVGKQRLALWLAQAILCEAGPGNGEGCGACRACKLVLNLSHPDVHWFVPVEPPKKAADPDKLVDLVAEALAE